MGKWGFKLKLFICHMLGWCVLLCSELAFTATVEDTSKGCETDAKAHVEVIRSSRHQFQIEVAGTLDPENLEITIENIAGVSAKNPRITVNGKYNWYTLEGMVAEITHGAKTDEEKAMTLFHFVANQSYWWPYPKDVTAFNPVRFFNIYGYHICSQAASMLVGLSRAAGLEARVYEIWHHTVTEVKWDGAWHHLDPDMRVWYLKDDNKTIASMADLERRPEWVSRTFKPYRWYLTAGDNRKVIYRPESETMGDSWANYYGTPEDNYVETGYDQWIYQQQTMDFTLRPQERLVRWWRPHLRKYYDQSKSQEPPRYANGQLIFEPDFTLFSYEEFVNRKNIKFKVEDGKSPAVHVANPQDKNHDQPSSLKIPMRSPYVMVGGYIDSKYYKGGTTGLDGVSLSADLDPTYHQRAELWSYIPWACCMGESRAVLDGKLRKDGPEATYQFDALYTVTTDKLHEKDAPRHPLVYGGQSGLDQIRIVADLQVNPGSLPALSLGRNTIEYSDETLEDHLVRVVYRWRERSGQHVPEAPAQAITPAAGSNVENLNPRLEWSLSRDPDGDAIVNYHIEVSLRSDCAWPVVSTLDRDVREGTSFQIPRGWLNPMTTYYWRVRAEDDKGNIGPWSRIFRFTTQ